MKTAQIQIVLATATMHLNGMDVEATAFLPRHAHEGDAGADIRAFLPDGPIGIEPGEVRAVPTGLSMRIPMGTGLLILPRSSFGARKLKVANSPGLIDHQYTGEVMVLLHNESEEPIVIEHGERIGQGVLVDVYQQQFERVDSLPETLRGNGGLGSTGAK